MAKTEREKMLAGELYIASDPELHTAHLRAQALLAKFNATAADARQERRASLTELFAHFGDETVLKPIFRCDYGFNISIGRRTFINYDCTFLDCNLITIGDEVQIRARRAHLHVHPPARRHAAAHLPRAGAPGQRR